MYKIAFIQSCWHKATVDQFKTGFANQIVQLEGPVDINYFEAPGVVEIPLLTKRCANGNKYDAIVVAGLIVDHGVYSHEFVAGTVMDAIMRVQMDQDIPIIYGILTAQDFMSEGRADFYHQHFETKGQESASACSKTLANMKLFVA